MKRAIRVLGGVAVLLSAAVFAEKDTPAPVNPFNGTQKREEVFEFTEAPFVKKDGDTWVISFTSKGNCDVTVAILGPDGTIVRHLASGVLGKNVPHPFRQNSLSQKIEWDGETDMGETAPAGCSVRVSLGLDPQFERSIGYDPYDIPTWHGGGGKKNAQDHYLIGQGPNDEMYVLGFPRNNHQGRVYTKDGKYVRTFWPPAAEDVKKLGQQGRKFAKTEWGDSTLMCHNRYGPAGMNRFAKFSLPEMGKEMMTFAGIMEYKEEARPEWLPVSTVPEEFFKLLKDKQMRVAVDRVRDKVYFTEVRNLGVRRFDGKTGELDREWGKNAGMDRVTECCVGPDGYLYMLVGALGYGQFVIRVDYDGKPVPFAGDAVPIPLNGKWEGGGGQYGKVEGEKIYGSRVCPRMLKKADVKALWTGHFGHSNTHERGLYISPRGFIVAGIQFPSPERAVKYGAPEDRVRAAKDGKVGRVNTSYVAVWDNEGKFLTANAVGDMQNGHGVAMDRDGNIYSVMGVALPAGVKTLVGLTTPLPKGSQPWGGYGSILKFRGGIPFPRSVTYHKKEGAPAPADAVKIQGGDVTGIKGVDDSFLWMYPGVVAQSPRPCTCHNIRYDMDFFARHWIPANYLHSVMVVDANANIIARVGRYGNVDDADPEYGKIHFVWPRALGVSDTALYVADPGNFRFLKAALKYHAEETVALE